VSGAEETAAEFVLDVSLSGAWCFADEAREPAWAILGRLQGGRAHVAALCLRQTADVLVQAERRSPISPTAIRTYLGILEGLPISVDQPSTASAWHDALALARSHRLPCYDGRLPGAGSAPGPAPGHARQGPPGGCPAGGSAPNALLKPEHP
jgi:hypothetical protein